MMSGGTTVLSDTFDTGHLDTEKWGQEITCWGGGNGEFQMYTNEESNTYVKNGELYLRPTYTAESDHRGVGETKTVGEIFRDGGTLDVVKQWGSCTNRNEWGHLRTGVHIPPIMSSKLISKASIAHGRVEVVAKLPKGDWIWPAIWLLPAGWPWKYGGWPASGEIDMIEARGNLDLRDKQGDDQGLNVVHSTIHFGPAGQHTSVGHRRKLASGSWGDDYHTYSLDWTEDHIRMDVDNQPIFHWDTPADGYWKKFNFNGDNIWSSGGRDAPFDQKFSLILNVAVGGKFFGDDWINRGYSKPWNNNTSDSQFWEQRDQWQPTWNGEDTAMKIKSVKMIQY